MSQRTLHLSNPLEKGPDVSKAQGLLASHGYMPKAGIDGVFGPQTADAARRAKFALGYPDTDVVPTFGALLFKYLAGGPMPADYLRRSEERKKDAHTGAALRARIVDYCRWGIANEPQIHYAQTRPYPIVAGVARKLPLATDCSGFAYIALTSAGVPGVRNDGLGYTGTLLAEFPPITAAMVQPGDLCVYGRFPGHHVVVAMEHGPDPICCSHGQEKGPFAIRASEEARYQPSPATWLRSVPATP